MKKIRVVLALIGVYWLYISIFPHSSVPESQMLGPALTVKDVFSRLTPEDRIWVRKLYRAYRRRYHPHPWRGWESNPRARQTARFRTMLVGDQIAAGFRNTYLFNLP